MKSTFADRLLQHMEKEGVTPAELAARMEADPGNVTNMLHNRRGVGLRTLAKILKALPKADARKLILGEKK